MSKIITIFTENDLKEILFLMQDAMPERWKKCIKKIAKCPECHGRIFRLTESGDWICKKCNQSFKKLPEILKENSTESRSSIKP